ncbi:MAG: hypothetical protein R3Y65_00465 [Bacillota bacterium]
MSKYKIIFAGEEEEEEFESREAAEDYAMYLSSCAQEGSETLHLSNPGDYPFEDGDDSEWEIIETK